MFCSGTFYSPIPTWTKAIYVYLTKVGNAGPNAPQEAKEAIEEASNY